MRYDRYGRHAGHASDQAAPSVCECEVSDAARAARYGGALMGLVETLALLLAATVLFMWVTSRTPPQTSGAAS